MSINAQFVQELEQEAQTTRRVLERVPEDKLGWKPHAKSWSLGQLALHVATVQGSIAEIAGPDSVPVPEDFSQAAPASSAEIMSALDDSLSSAKAALEGWDDAAMGATWKAMAGDQEVMAIPRAALLRSIMFNHLYHHRGQLAVYLRLLDVPVPSIYGPSADENPFA